MCSLLGKGADAPGMGWRVVVRVAQVKRRCLDDILEEVTDYLNLFCPDDLDGLFSQTRKKQPFGRTLGAYLGALVEEA